MSCSISAHHTMLLPMVKEDCAYRFDDVMAVLGLDEEFLEVIHLKPATTTGYHGVSIERKDRWVGGKATFFIKGAVTSDGSWQPLTRKGGFLSAHSAAEAREKDVLEFYTQHPGSGATDFNKKRHKYAESHICIMIAALGFKRE